MSQTGPKYFPNDTQFLYKRIVPTLEYNVTILIEVAVGANCKYHKYTWTFYTSMTRRNEVAFTDVTFAKVLYYGVLLNFSVKCGRVYCIGRKQKQR